MNTNTEQTKPTKSERILKLFEFVIRTPIILIVDVVRLVLVPGLALLTMLMLLRYFPEVPVAMVLFPIISFLFGVVIHYVITETEKASEKEKGGEYVTYYWRKMLGMWILFTGFIAFIINAFVNPGIKTINLETEMFYILISSISVLIFPLNQIRNGKPDSTKDSLI